MSRRNYFELLEKQDFNASHELESINMLLKEEIYSKYSIKREIQKNFLRYSKRGVFIRFDQLEVFIEKKLR